MVKCRIIDFDGNEWGHITAPFVPQPGDMLTTTDADNKPVGVMVHSRHLGTVDIDDARAVNDIVLVVYTEQATIPDHDYTSGRYIPNKYRITKQDGSPTDPNANYFVLRLDTDPNALTALKVYADSVAFNHDNVEFKNDLYALIEKMREKQKRG